jgi:hypothetical protein
MNSQLAHRVTTQTTASAFTASCEGCGWTGSERTTEFAADIEGMMHEFDGNGGQS